MDYNSWLHEASFYNIYDAESFQDMTHKTITVQADKNTAYLVDEGDFYRAYWVLYNIETLPEILSKCLDLAGQKGFISEILYRNDLPPIVDRFLVKGIGFHSKLQYMSRKAGTLCTTNATTICEKAKPSDAEELLELLRANFDSKVSHLPDVLMLRDMIEKNEVSVIRQGSTIPALAIFQTTGSKTKYLFQLLTDAEFRGRGYADALLSEELYTFGNNFSYSLWVVDDNTCAIGLYDRYGFIPNGRKIVVLRGERQ